MVTEDCVSRIMGLTVALKNIRYMPSRKKALAEVIEVMPEEDKWLLIFCTWQCLFNTRFKAIDPDKLCFTEPASVNQTTFMDFLNFLRRHNGVRISPSRVKPLVQLLSKCDRTHRDFYLTLMSKEWINDLPVMELQTMLDLDSINSEKIYGELEFLRTSFSDLKYPVALRKVSTEPLTPYILIKEPLSSMLMVNKNKVYKKEKKNDKVAIDLRLSNTPRFTVAGFYDSTTYYPTDYFETCDDCVNYLNGESYKFNFATRVAHLNTFLNRTMLVHSDATESILVNDEKGLLEAIAKLSKDDITGILVCDEDTVKTGKPYRITCRVASGIIDSIEKDAVNVWFNGEVVKCSYAFAGKEQALLSNPEILKDKLMKFHFVKVGKTEYCFGKGIMWHQPRWREMRLRESGAWIEKCALCGSTRYKHANRGICKVCEANLKYYFNTYGTDNWITPSAQMEAKRFKSVWKPSVLNLVGYKYKGTILEAKEDGSWRFTQGEENGES